MTANEARGRKPNRKTGPDKPSPAQPDRIDDELSRGAKKKRKAGVKEPTSLPRDAMGTAAQAAPPGMRVVIEAVAPEIDNGRSAAKRAVGEIVTISADIFSDGHEMIAADLLFRPADEAEWRRTPMRPADNDRWTGHFVPDRNTRYLYTIEAWRDPFATWVRDTRKKIAARQDVAASLRVGRALAETSLANFAEGTSQTPNIGKESPAGLDELLSEPIITRMDRAGPRLDVSRYPLTLELVVDRRKAQFSSWYELFPRSQSNDLSRQGTFDDVIGRLSYIRDLGFDVLYLPPIHPIGTTNRKGRNNSLDASDKDPGSVYAIGSPAGGHISVHPELGTLADFNRLVAAARLHDIEIALDFAVQCSLDHPWIKEHPDWFDWRADGTIAYAENPPKKYEDIVNLRFSPDTFPALWNALRDVILFWIDQGVTIFRVDNPHTKPVPFWEWLIREINDRYPSVVFLAEAFTRPKMMGKLAKIGFQQSYTYFTWRNTKSELISYVAELTGEMSDYYRPNFFTNTPDINPHYLQTSGRPGFIVRATLAATLSSNWGIYSGFELCESAALGSREEYLDSEKYELKIRDYDAPGNIAAHIRALNRIRSEHRALQDFRNVIFLNAWNDNIIAYARATPQRDDFILILVNLDPHHSQACSYEVPLWEFGLLDWDSVEAEDLLNRNKFVLHGKIHEITLDPVVNPVVIWRLHGPVRAEPTP